MQSDKFLDYVAYAYLTVVLTSIVVGGALIIWLVGKVLGLFS